jgi:type II secretion system protein L
LVKQLAPGLYQWSKGDAAEVFTGDGEQLAAEAGAAALCFIVPAETVTLRRVNYEKSERKLLAQTLPFSLEDELVDDVDQLHFALGPLAEQQAPVAIIGKGLLGDWLNLLRDEGLSPRYLIPEQLLLPLTEQGWTLLLDGERLLLRTEDSAAYYLDTDNAELLLQLLLDESAMLPEQLQLFSCGEPAIDVAAVLPELLRDKAEVQQLDYWQLMLPQLESACAFNLLQGKFAQPLPWKKWWHEWRLVAGLAVLAVTVQLLSAYFQVSALENENLRLRQAVEQSYREAVPRGALMDAERQLLRKVEALRGSGAGNFLSLFDRVAAELAALKDVQLMSVNYSEKQYELRLVLLAPSFNSVEQLRGQLVKAGLQAELTGSNKDGSNTRARLRVKG